MLTVALLLLSNIFMTFAWYGHLNFKSAPLWQVVLFSWGIAFFEYCLAVPANRFGSFQFTTAQLKIMQEVITLLVFSGFSIIFLKEQLKWNYIAAFVLVIGAVSLVFLDTKGSGHKEAANSTYTAETVIASDIRN